MTDAEHELRALLKAIETAEPAPMALSEFSDLADVLREGADALAAAEREVAALRVEIQRIIGENTVAERRVRELEAAQNAIIDALEESCSRCDHEGTDTAPYTHCAACCRRITETAIRALLAAPTGGAE